MAKVRKVLYGGNAAWVEAEEGRFTLSVKSIGNTWPANVFECKTLSEMQEAVKDLRSELNDISHELEYAEFSSSAFHDFFKEPEKEATE